MKILILEDNQDDVLIIERVLRKAKLSFEKMNVDSRNEFSSAINTFKPDVILSDHSLPGFNSREALRICREELGTTPFILVSGTSSDDFVASCLREGADDYIAKSDLSGLPAAIRTAIKKRKNQKLKREELLNFRRQFREMQVVNKSLDNFTYTIAHNLRGPITSLMGLLNLAHQANDVETIRSLQTMMQTAVTRLNEALIGLLQHSRNIHQQKNHQLINWQLLIQDTTAKLEYLDPHHQLKRNIYLKTETPFYSDPERIAMVLTNLLSNALVYRNTLHKQEVYLTIEVFTTIESGVLVVKDNGIGIRPEILPRVYDMFFRGTESSTGAGLGLYIVKEIVSALNGTIDIKSTEGRGTEVRVELPNNIQHDESE